ncbi:MAG: VOC family protein [Pseudomonadota bacterium]
MLELDHLAVACETLEDGREAVETALGVTLQPGGQHARFGTHNLLLGLEDGLYLEVIAIDPAAPKPSVPRWFDLDRFDGFARLTNWICRCDDLEAHVARQPRVGVPVDLARGSLRWRMAVPENGQLPFDNCHPAVMQWSSADHPAARLTPSGCRLERLVVTHPEAKDLRDMVGPMEDARIHIEAGEAGLRAEFATPFGPRVLS